MRIIPLILALTLLVAACSQDAPDPTLQPAPSPTPTAPPAATAVLDDPTPAPADEPSPPSTPALATQAPSPTPEPGPPVDPQAVYSRVLADLARLRGLPPTEAVTPQFLTRDELQARLLENLEENAEDILHAEILYKMLGLISQDADLHQLFLDLYTDQVAGFYDSEAEELFLISGSQDDGLSALDEITLAHEFTHALQQQHFDIDSMLEAVEDDSDAGAALRALVEGDASVAQYRYMFSHLDRDRQAEALAGSADVDSSSFDSTPYILRQSLVFPYDQGLTFVTALIAQGSGWDNVNDAFDNPPVSTEQVLHPGKYASGETPVAVSLPDVADALGEGWEDIYSDVMGEFFLRTYLETRTAEQTAAEAASGWGGDRFALLRGPGPDDEYALVSLMEWDTAQDAIEFLDAMTLSGSVSDEDFLGSRGTRVLWVLSDSEQTTERVRALWTGF